MSMLILYLFLALGVSFLCSILEAVILSIPLPYIHSHIKTGSNSALKLRKLKNNIDQPLSAILSLNTIAHTIGAAGVGAQAVAIFGNQWFGIISAILTLLILFISEIIPKTIGATFWRELSKPTAYILDVIIVLMYPLVVVSGLLTRLFSREKNPQILSREEIAVLTDLGAEEGVFNENERKIINNTLLTQSLKVKEIMTPRTVLATAPETMKLVDFFSRKEFFAYSRIPVYQESIDEITGYILKYQLMEKLLDNQGKIELKEIKREIITCYESFTVSQLFNLLIEKNEHIALVLNEYGSTEGIVTMEDIIETILGREIIDERDDKIDMQLHAREKWRIRSQTLKNRFLDLRNSKKKK
ncbi:CNNM domain-containing protein [Sunxiuqinia sp. A32]|uniref:CNNM domain-containing protein n=1 Tax=Sunxiuqinia sp. A32 TaxID=3461496 RepID=UPI0040451AEE